MPLHRAAENGNPTCLEWVINKWAEHNKPLPIDVLDSNGNTALYLCCMKGYLGGQGMENTLAQDKRLQCVHILLSQGANINFKTEKLKMTCLHWAAYQGDARLVELLLDKYAVQTVTTFDIAPVDIAGFCGNTDAVLSFCKHFEKTFTKMLTGAGMASMMGGGMFGGGNQN